jgi:phosphatidylglycerol:prolipoprotein diacylglycerol transferase
MAFDFPALHPVAFSIGPLPIRWYALAYLTGFLLGWAYALRLARLEKDGRPTREDIDDFLPWAIAGVILGGRLGYVLFYQPALYLAEPLEALKLWHGGMSFHGGALGVIAALIIYPYRRNIPHLRLADIVCASVPIGLFFGRIANFINGELFGRVTDVPWAVKFPAGGYLPRHPSQLYEAGLEGLVLFFILFALIRCERVRQRPGIVSGVFLLGYGLFRSFIELFREPDEQLGFIIGHISMGQVLSLPMMLAGMGLIAYALLRKKIV